MTSRGQSVPDDFRHIFLFWTFQYERYALLRKLPMSIGELAHWAWICGRWAVKKATDMSSGGDFRDVLATADALALRLAALSTDAGLRLGVPVPSMLSNEFANLMLRFATIRSQYVRVLHAGGLLRKELRNLHADYTKIACAYAHDTGTLPDFLTAVETQLTTQCAGRGTPEEQVDYCTRAFLCLAHAFISSLRGGLPPASPNALYGPAAPATAPPPPPPPPPPPAPTFAFPMYSQPNPAFAPAGQLWYAAPPPTYSMVQQPSPGLARQDHPPTGMHSLESMVRQTPAGYLGVGIAPNTGGAAAEGLDLTPPARSVILRSSSRPDCA